MIYDYLSLDTPLYLQKMPMNPQDFALLAHYWSNEHESKTPRKT